MGNAGDCKNQERIKNSWKLIIKKSFHIDL